jgi:Na+-transporting NADH:ubiquinone oxidoreductase subunit B
MRWVVFASLPCAAMALYNTGYQANLALAGGAASLSDWRDGAMQLLGAHYDATRAWDCLLHGALYLFPLLGASFAGGGLAELLFARLRARRPDHVALNVIALVFTLCLPPTLPLWKAALGCFAGVAVGKEIFGGFGRNFVNPALAGLALLYFAYPGSVTGEAVWVAVDGYSGATPLAAAARDGLEAVQAAGYTWTASWLGWVPGAMGATSTLACLIGAGLLLYAGIASWRILAGGLLGLALGVELVQWIGTSHTMAEMSWSWHAVVGGFAFGLVFLATDPVTAAGRDPRRQSRSQ